MSADSSHRISVALVTRNRPESLDRCLASLRAQDVQPWEVVVSDDSTSDAVRVSEIARRWGCRYVPGPRRGLYANRNHAALACTGSHIRSMDDDHEFPPGHFARCEKAVAEDPESVWVIGEYAESEEVKPPPHPCPPELHPRGFAVRPPDCQHCWAIADGSTIYPRAIFEAGARFVEAFNFGYNFQEFGSYLHAMGYRMRHLDDTYVLHHNTSRSIDDPRGMEASRLFAIACHSFVYQPTVRNVALTTLTWMRSLVFDPANSWPGAGKAIQAYRARRREFRDLVRRVRLQRVPQ